jgi:hypothetical protein
VAKNYTRLDTSWIQDALNRNKNRLRTRYGYSPILALNHSKAKLNNIASFEQNVADRMKRLKARMSKCMVGGPGPIWA